MAGVDRFDKFGAKVTIKNFMEKYHRSMQEVLDSPAYEIYDILLIDFEESEFQKQLSIIQKQKLK